MCTYLTAIHLHQPRWLHRAQDKWDFTESSTNQVLRKRVGNRKLSTRTSPLPGAMGAHCRATAGHRADPSDLRSCSTESCNFTLCVTRGVLIHTYPTMNLNLGFLTWMFYQFICEWACSFYKAKFSLLSADQSPLLENTRTEPTGYRAISKTSPRGCGIHNTVSTIYIIAFKWALA